MGVYTGQLIGVCEQSSGTPAAFCRKIDGGSVEFEDSWLHNVGIAGQVVAIPGVIVPSLSITCIGVAKATLQKWFPTTAAAQVADFPGFLAEVVGGRKFTFDDCQPGPATISIDEGETAVLKYDLSVLAATVDETTGGSASALWTSELGYSINHITAQIDSADVGIRSWSLSNGIATAMGNPMDTKASGSQRLPGGQYVTGGLPSVSIVTEDLLVAAESMFGDTPANYDLTFVCSNGTDSMTITLADWVMNGPAFDLAPEGLVGFRYTFQPDSGTVYNRVVIS